MCWITVRSYNCHPKGTGQKSNVVEMCVSANSHMLVWYFYCRFPLMSHECDQENTFFSFHSLTPPYLLNNQSNAFKTWQNSFHFEVLISALALKHPQCHHCPLVAVLNHIMFQKENFIFLFLDHAVSQIKTRVPENHPFKNVKLWGFEKTKGKMMNFNLHGASSLLNMKPSSLWRAE